MNPPENDPGAASDTGDPARTRLEPPTIPRMPGFAWWPVAAGMALWLGWQALTITEVVRPELALLGIAATWGWLGGVLASRWLVFRWYERRLFHDLKSLGLEGRQALFDQVDDPMAEAAIRYGLAEHGELDEEGVTERFSESPVVQAENRFLLRSCVLFAVALLGSAAFLQVDAGWRWSLFATGLMFGALTIALRVREERLRHVFAISPFAISEHRGDGSVLRVHGAVVSNSWLDQGCGEANCESTASLHAWSSRGAWSAFSG